MFVIKIAPFKTLHNRAISWENPFYPRDNFLKILPQLGRVFVVLMLGHIVFDKAITYPCQCLLQKILPNWRTAHILFAYRVGWATSFRKPSLSVRQPRSSVGGISDLLFRQRDASNVNNVEPIEPFFIGAFTDVNRQFVIQNLPLFFGSQIIKSARLIVPINRKFTIQILANVKFSFDWEDRPRGFNNLTPEEKGQTLDY